MHRSAIFICSSMLLGCGGVATGIAEWVSGADIEVADDHVVMHNADGTTNVITQGEHAVRPDDFPIPGPPGDLAPDSVIDSADGGARTVSYKLPEDSDPETLIAFYEQWFADQGIDAMSETKNLAGTRTSALAGSRDGAVYAVTFTEMLGTRMLSLAVTPAR